MLNNDTLRSIRYMLDLGDVHVVEIMKLSGFPATREQVEPWLRKEDEPGFAEMPDNSPARAISAASTPGSRPLVVYGDSVGLPFRGGPIMHHSRLCTLVLDCHDGDLVAASEFWSRALGKPIETTDDDGDGKYAVLK